MVKRNLLKDKLPDSFADAGFAGTGNLGARL